MVSAMWSKFVATVIKILLVEVQNKGNIISNENRQTNLITASNMELQAYLYSLHHSYTSNNTQFQMIDTNEFTKPQSKLKMKSS
jgi:hypothetical protein